MSYKVVSIPQFDKQVKRLAKKYPSIKKDLNKLSELLTNNPIQGDFLGNNFYKVRMLITSKGKGKSGGARVITYLKIIQTTVFLASIYDKSEKNNITDQELEKLFMLLP